MVLKILKNVIMILWVMNNTIGSIESELNRKFIDICSSIFRIKILHRFGMDFHGFWFPFRFHFLTFVMFSAYLFRASNLHRFFIDFRRISGTPDHVKKRFERYTLHKKQEIAGFEISWICHRFWIPCWHHFGSILS